MTPPFRVACIGPDNSWIYREMLRGFNAVAQSRRWMIDRISEYADWREQLLGFPPEALLITASVAEKLTARERAGRVAVVIGGQYRGIASVGVDDQAVGKCAAEHLLARNLKSFAAYGIGSPGFWCDRRRGFIATIEQAGFAVNVDAAALQPTDVPLREQDPQQNLAEMAHRWLERLPKPVGILAGCDSWAEGLLFANRRYGLRVPDEVAVVGVDNDAFITELCFPPLSSVAIPWQKVGHEAALIMEQLVSGKKVNGEPILISPCAVRARRSSDILAVEEPDVAAALQYIRAHADRPIRPPDILRHVPVYRKKLERNFRRYVGSSITEEVRRAHVERAKHLLTATDLPMIEVADRSGFTSQAKFSVAFRRETGQTPSKYRRSFGDQFA
jgi:LacI family transcriptional regulator